MGCIKALIIDKVTNGKVSIDMTSFLTQVVLADLREPGNLIFHLFSDILTAKYRLWFIHSLLWFMKCTVEKKRRTLSCYPCFHICLIVLCDKIAGGDICALSNSFWKEWVKSWVGLLLVTDVLTTWAEVIESKWPLSVTTHDDNDPCVPCFAASPFLIGQALWVASRFTPLMSPELLTRWVLLLCMNCNNIGWMLILITFYC